MYILGPCSAESREQILTCAEQIAEIVSHSDSAQFIFRAGVWKPRTSPDSFQGAGDIALSWLQEVQSTYHLPVATEVATPEQVRKALEAGIDYLWIGARTSANPIAVQELANALNHQPSSPFNGDREGLSGIFIKNPVNEDTALWIGNIRRLQSALSSLNPQPSTINHQPFIAAIHRGCGHRPCWRMAYEFRKTMPDIPLLLDPSHLSGDASRIDTLCHTSENLGLDGLMIEVHPTPESALSDSRQQITPSHFAQILSSLNHQPSTLNHKPSTLNYQPSTLNSLTWLRAIMDETDDALWDIFLTRMNISKEIGAYKRENKIEVVQTNRWNEVLERRKKWAADHDLSEDAILQIMNAIHEESCRVQK